MEGERKIGNNAGGDVSIRGGQKVGRPCASMAPDHLSMSQKSNDVVSVFRWKYRKERCFVAVNGFLFSKVYVNAHLINTL